MNIEERRALSSASWSGFDPRAIPWQHEASIFMRDFDYSTGTPEVLLSGSVGSAKSIWMAHQIVRHCLKYPNACAAIGRRAMPDLRRTIFKEILNHISEDFTEGVHYEVNKTSSSIKFLHNGAEIISVSWADGRYDKFKSLKLSALCIEELTENDEEDFTAFQMLKARLRRVDGVPQNFLITATNPGAPSSWQWKYWFASDLPTRKIFFSLTEDNPYLDPVYIEQLKRDLDPIQARRLLYGEWIELNQERIYHAYESNKNFIKDKYQPNRRYPLILSFDFNIGEGKPMSSVAMQYIDDRFHIFDGVVVQGANTQEVIEEWSEKGYLSTDWQVLIRGDASGKHRDTRSKTTDWHIIRSFLDLHRIPYKFEVPLENPAIRHRHGRVNTYCKNQLGEHRLFVYQGAEIADEGLRLTAFKKGGQLVEDDSKDYQHITTAIGYAVYYETAKSKTNSPPSWKR